MTPEEKADELVKKFMPHTVYYHQSQECALIAVDEIINNIINTPPDYGASWTYWQEVKQEIKKL